MKMGKISILSILMYLIVIVMVSLKILFQKICISKIGWDAVIRDDLVKEFYDGINEIKTWGELSITR